MSIIQSLIETSNAGGSAPPPPPPQDSIDAQYFSDNDSWYVLGGGAGAGSRNNTTSVSYTYPDGSTGYVVPFTGAGGSSEYMFSPNLKVGNQTWSNNSITIDIWFYPTAYNIQLMSETESVRTDGIGYHYSMLEIDGSGFIKARFWDGGGGHVFTSEATVTLNAWNHVYFYEDTQGGHDLQVNGTRNQSTQAPTYTRQAPTNGEFFSIGWGDASAMVTTNPFQGKIGDINIHDYVVNTTYYSTRSRYSPPAMLLNLDVSNTSSYPGTGTTWYNLVSGGHDATFNSAPAIINQGSKSIDFAGMNWATLPADVWFDQDFTIVAWVRLHGYSNWERIMDFGSGPNINNILLAASDGTSGTPALRSETTQFSATGSTIPVSKWTQVVGRVTAGGQGTIFINGANVFGYSGMTTPFNVTRTACYIGKSNWNTDALLNGEIGEFQIYHGALTDSNISLIYNATKNKYPNTYSFTTIHLADGSSNDRWGGFSVIDAGQTAPQVGWTISDFTNTATITGVLRQNTALGFVYTLTISGTLDNTADYVAITGL